MTTKNCANGPKLVLKDLCKKSFVQNVLYSGIFNLIVGFLHKNYTFCPLDCLKDFHFKKQDQIFLTNVFLPLMAYKNGQICQISMPDKNSSCSEAR